MKFLFSELFWGSLLILGGISIILKAFLGINIPIFRILFAVLLIYSGVILITGPKFQWNTKQTFMFSETYVKADELNHDYTTAFSNTTIDLTDIRLTESKKIKISTIFGQTIIKINKDIPTEISVKASFANAELPNKTSTSFGKIHYKTAQYASQVDHLSLEASVIFGSLEIIEV